MELFIFISLCVFYFLFFKKYDFKFLLFIFLLIDGTFIIYLINSEGLLIGKGDQYYYYNFANDYIRHHKISELIFIPYEANYHNFLYLLVYSFINYISFFSPIFSMRELNFILHLGIIFFLYRSLLLITHNKQKSKKGAILLLFSPTLLSFDIYVIRDIFIVFSFAGAIYYILKIHYSKYTFITFLKLIFFILINFSLRGQLGLILFLLLLLVILNKFVTINIINGLFLIFVILYLVSMLPINIGGFQVIGSLLPSLFNLELLKIFIIKFPLYFLGLGFLDPTTKKELSLFVIFITRSLSFDSIIIPFLFVILYLKNKFSYELKQFISIVLIVYILYFFLYMFAEYYWKGYGFHFRAYLPFFYVFYLSVLSSIKFKVKYGKKIIFSY